MERINVSSMVGRKSVKKILILSNIVWTISNFRQYLIQDLINNGFKVYCVADKDEFETDSIQQIEKLGAIFIPIKTNRKGVNPFSETLYFMRLFFIFKRIAPDAILSYTIKPNIFGSLAARLLNIPQIATINGLGSGILGGSIIAKISFFLYNVALKYPKKIFFQNTDDRDYFLKNKIIQKTKAAYVPGSGINPDDFHPSPRQGDNQKTIFLLVARLLADKGVYEYIEAAKEILQKQISCEFLLAGPFDEENPTAIQPEEVMQWENENIIRYLGKTNNIEDFFILTDVVVLPSYREGLSRLLLEAACCQKPIITTNVPGCKELVNENVNGFLCDAMNTISLINAIEKMLSISLAERNTFGINSRKMVIEYFGKDRVNDLYLNTIKEII